MAQDSKIEWTDHTFNPLWGCQRVNECCTNCYAETLAHRWGFDIWGAAKTTKRREFGDKHWDEPLKWNRKAAIEGQRKKVFCGSMCDVFENHLQWEFTRPRLFSLIENTPFLDWLLLTKRPENIIPFIPDSWMNNPPKNVWYGTSIGMKKHLWMAKELQQVPAAVRFLSVEPLIEDLGDLSAIDLSGIHQIIVGGESGGGKRPFNVDWARSIRDYCKSAGIAFFMKQVDKVQAIPEDLMIRQSPVHG